jgi:hypothetical protein
VFLPDLAQMQRPTPRLQSHCDIRRTFHMEVKRANMCLSHCAPVTLPYSIPEKEWKFRYLRTALLERHVTQA